MLCVNSYPQSFIDNCRGRMESQLAAYQALKSGSNQAAIDTFEPLFFGNLVLALDAYFMHRSRTLELKDGNPANEVRILSASLAQGNSTLVADKSIKYKPEASILGIAIGGEIRLNEADFERLFKAYFTEIEKKFRA